MRVPTSRLVERAVGQRRRDGPALVDDQCDAGRQESLSNHVQRALPASWHRRWSSRMPACIVRAAARLRDICQKACDNAYLCCWRPLVDASHIWPV